MTALVDSTGTVQERYVYAPYGAVTVLTPSYGSRSSSNYAWVYAHQGERMEISTGLNNSRARDFSPALQRWVERDYTEFGAGDPNFYRTESNNPTGLTDPSGLDPMQITLTNGGVGGASLLARLGGQGLGGGEDGAGGNGGNGAGQGNAGGMGGGGGGAGQQNAEQGIGQPSFGGSFIPIYGSGRSMIDHWQNGRYGWAAVNGVLLVSDFFLVGWAVKGLAKLGGKLLGKIAPKLAPGAAKTTAKVPLVHLTDATGEAGIKTSGVMRGKQGIFAVPEKVAKESTLKKVARTGLSPAQTAKALPIPQEALQYFSRVMPYGLYPGWKFFGGVRYIPASAINMATGALTRINRLRTWAILYGPDIVGNHLAKIVNSLRGEQEKK